MAWESIIKRKQLPAPKDSGAKDRVSDFKVPTLRDRLGPYAKNISGDEIFESLHGKIVDAIVHPILLNVYNLKSSPELEEIKRELKELELLLEDLY
jgi:hypothetical protein